MTAPLRSLPRRAEPLPDLSRVSLNQISVNRWSLPEAVEGCARHGLGWIGLWRDKVNAFGAGRSARLLRDSGVRASSLCRGGFFAAATQAEKRRRGEDNRRAVDEAFTVGADLLVLVCGPPVGGDLDGARETVAEGIADLAPYASQAGVRLGIEPLHPMFAGDRSVVVTLAEANDIAARFPSDQVGVVVDVYHVWWDPRVYQEIARAGERTAGFHVSDWIVPLPDPLLGRGLMGDGIIELRRLRAAVEDAGYRGPIEVEIFNQALWDLDGDRALQAITSRSLAHV
jgi:sugar phosphate isomerase/epimerase